MKTLWAINGEFLRAISWQFHRIFNAFFMGFPWEKSHELNHEKPVKMQADSCKSAITPSILHAAFDLFYFSIPLHATMWALFLVAFFTFLCKSNLVPDNPRQISPKVITCIGQIWSSPPQALIFMSQLLKPFSASSALLFCLFPRSLGLVFAPSLRYVAIYRSILVKARLPFLLFYRDRP